MAVPQQFRQDTLSVDLHQILRRILGGKLETLKNPDQHRPAGKQLCLDFLLRRPYVLFHDQPGTVQVDREPVLLPGGRDPLHLRLLQLVVQRSTYI